MCKEADHAEAENIPDDHTLKESLLLSTCLSLNCGVSWKAVPFTDALSFVLHIKPNSFHI